MYIYNILLLLFPLNLFLLFLYIYSPKYIYYNIFTHILLIHKIDGKLMVFVVLRSQDKEEAAKS